MSNVALCIFRESSGERKTFAMNYAVDEIIVLTNTFDIVRQAFILYTDYFRRLKNELYCSRDTAPCSLLFYTTAAIVNFTTQLLEINDVLRPRDSWGS